MTSCLVCFVAATAALVPVAASAQTVDQMLADHTLLRSELDRCKQLGLASNDDPRCRTARTAEQRRFFGDGGSTYMQQPVDVFPGHEQFDPQPSSQKSAPRSHAGPPHG